MGSAEKASTLKHFLGRFSLIKAQLREEEEGDLSHALPGWLQPWALPTLGRAGSLLCPESQALLSVQEQPEQSSHTMAQSPRQGWPQAPCSTAQAERGYNPGEAVLGIQSPQGRQLITLTVFFNFSMSAEFKNISTTFSGTNHFALFLK